MNGCFVRHWADVGILHTNIETLLQRQVVEFVVDVVSILDVFLEADDGKAFKSFRLVHH